MHTTEAPTNPRPTTPNGLLDYPVVLPATEGSDLVIEFAADSTALLFLGSLPLVRGYEVDCGVLTIRWSTYHALDLASLARQRYGGRLVEIRPV